MKNNKKVSGSVIFFSFLFLVFLCYCFYSPIVNLFKTDFVSFYPWLLIIIPLIALLIFFLIILDGEVCFFFIIRFYLLIFIFLFGLVVKKINDPNYFDTLFNDFWKYDIFQFSIEIRYQCHDWNNLNSTYFRNKSQFFNKSNCYDIIDFNVIGMILYGLTFAFIIFFFLFNFFPNCQILSITSQNENYVPL